MSAAAARNAFLILGHGEEEVVDFEDRPTLSAGYTLVTIEECGLVATADSVVPFMEAFSNEANRAIFENPRENQAAIEGFMGGKKVHVYSAGMKYPKLQLQFFLDWPSEESTKIQKSGTYRFPLDADAFMIGSGSTFAEKVFKKIGPYTGYSNDFPADFNAGEMFGGSLYPTPEKVSEAVAAMKSRDPVVKFVTRSFEKVMDACGPGVYYYVVCRSPKAVINPRRLVEFTQLLPEHAMRYEPYYTKNWIKKIPEIIPLLEENAGRYKYWIKDELQGAIADYSRLMRVPMIRQASLNQQAAAAAAAGNAAAAAAGNARRRKTRRGRKGRKNTRRNRK